MKSLTAYQEVKQKITEDLVRGRFPMGQALPAEKDLQKSWMYRLARFAKRSMNWSPKELLFDVRERVLMLLNTTLSDYLLFFPYCSARC